MALKALVADDDEMSLEILEYILESKGYHITKATDGDQAVRKLNTENFDLVITDLRMGPTSGFDVIRKAKDINSNTTVIMITGSCDSADKIEAFHSGTDDYLLKPFSPTDLLISIQFQKYKQIVTSAFTLEGEQRAANVSG